MSEKNGRNSNLLAMRQTTVTGGKDVAFNLQKFLFANYAHGRGEKSRRGRENKESR